MIQKKVLITFGSRYGCTKEISRKIGQFLDKKENLIVNIVDLRQKNGYKPVTLAEYDGIIVGSGIRIGRWTKQAKVFLKKYKEELKDSSRILGIFVSCGYAADTKHYPVAKKMFLEQVFRKMELQPAIYEAFGGIFDFSTSSNVGFIDKKILKLGASDLDLPIDYKAKNNYLDWNRIEQFSEEFAKLLAAR